MNHVSPFHRWLTFVIFLSVLISLIGAMSLIWTRVQIRKSADRIERTERVLTDLNRRIQQVDTQIAQAHQPDRLIARVEGRMRVPEPRQIVWHRPAERDGDRLVPGVAFTGAVGVAQVSERDR